MQWRVVDEDRLMITPSESLQRLVKKERFNGAEPLRLQKWRQKMASRREKLVHCSRGCLTKQMKSTLLTSLDKVKPKATMKNNDVLSDSWIGMRKACPWRRASFQHVVTQELPWALDLFNIPCVDRLSEKMQLIGYQSSCVWKINWLLRKLVSHCTSSPRDRWPKRDDQ